MKPSLSKKEVVSVLALEPEAFLYIPSDIYGQIIGACIGCDIEISGMGQLVPYESGYLVTKMHIGKQSCTAVETTLCGDWIADLEQEVMDGEHGEGELAWWWHSHVDMKTYWSGTDMTAIDQMSKPDCRIISTVFNRKFQFLTSYSQGESRDGFYPKVFKDGLKTVIIPSDEIVVEIDEKVERVVYTAPKPVKGVKLMSDNVDRFGPLNWKTHSPPNFFADEEYEAVIADVMILGDVSRTTAVDMYQSFKDVCGYESDEPVDILESYAIFKSNNFDKHNKQIPRSIT